jgi:sulfonate transport system permease protein
MKNLSKFIPSAVAVILLVGVWQAAFSLGFLTLESFPPPSDIANSLGELVTSGDLVEPLLQTLWVVMVASICALAIGTATGALLGLSRPAYNWGMASVDFMRTIPVVALLPVAVLLWGPTTQSELIISTYAAAWVMAVNTAGGFAEVHPRLGDVAQTFQLRRFESLRKVRLPAIVPSMLVGARLSVVVAAISATIAEALVNPKGLGWEIMRAQQALDPGKLWAYALVAGLFGYLLNLVLVLTVRALSPGIRVETSVSGA